MYFYSSIKELILFFLNNIYQAEPEPLLLIFFSLFYHQELMIKHNEGYTLFERNFGYKPGVAAPGRAKEEAETDAPTGETVNAETKEQDAAAESRDYDKEFISDVLIEAWDQVNTLVQNKMTDLPF